MALKFKIFIAWRFMFLFNVAIYIHLTFDRVYKKMLNRMSDQPLCRNHCNIST